MRPLSLPARRGLLRFLPQNLRGDGRYRYLYLYLYLRLPRAEIQQAEIERLEGSA